MGHNMGGYIKELPTRAKADLMNEEHFMVYKEICAADGYTIVPEGVVGKKNGVDNPTAQITTAWDLVQESPNHTFYIEAMDNPTPAQEARFNAIQMGARRLKPDSWNVRGDS